QVQPRMKVEERHQVGLTAQIERAKVKGEDAAHHQKDHHEYIRQGCGKVARQFSSENNAHSLHAATPACCPTGAPLTPALAAAAWVTLRKSSSSRPSTRWNSASGHCPT